MDPRDYRDARWHSLVREAARLGVSEDDAPGVVEAVLAAQERRIRRAADPDPLVRDALRAAAPGPRTPTPPRRRSGRGAVALGVLLALTGVGAAAALMRPDPPPTSRLAADQVPSLFGYDGPDAARLLSARGLRVDLQPFQACEVLGRVVGLDPPVGTTYDDGDPITVYTAIPADITCLTDYQDRELAWQWVDFARGEGGAPSFAGRVWVYPGDGRRIVLTGRDAAQAATWQGTGILTTVRSAVDAVDLVSDRPLHYRAPAVRVAPATDGAGSCGVPDPPVAGLSDAVAVLVLTADRRRCPVRLELYRDADGRVEGVALYRS